MQWEVNFLPHISDVNFQRQLITIESNRMWIADIPMPPAYLEYLNQINIVRAIRGTTAIEGNALDEGAITEIIHRSNPSATGVSLEEQEILNSDTVQKFIVARDSSAINEPLLRDLHKLTTQNCQYSSNVPGEYRNHSATDGISHRYPEPRDIPRLMREFCEFVNSPGFVDHHPVIQAVLAHFYLISIHPFGDGNGRTSRALEALILHQGGYNVVGFYGLANYFYRHKSEYINQLQDARFRLSGDLNQFVSFALKGYIEELGAIREFILDWVKRLAYMDYVRQETVDGRLNARINRFLRRLALEQREVHREDYFGRRDPHVHDIWHGKGDRTLRRDLDNMKHADLIVERGGILAPNITLMDAFTGSNYQPR